MGLSSSADIMAQHSLSRAASPARPSASSPVSRPHYPAVSPVSLRRPPAAGTRTFDVAALRMDGSRALSQVTVPALPVFEQAFSAFARGTLLQTPHGEIAIEDLLPGDMLATQAGGPARVIWIGSGSFSPVQASGRRVPMVRVMADAFGAGRPDMFVTLGPSARVLQTPPRLRGESQQTSLLTPAREFVDGVNVIEVLPPTPVHLFHVVLERHAVITAGGLECETFHPGSQSLRALSMMQRTQFFDMFMHIERMSDFGPLAVSRAPDFDPDLAAAGY